MTAERLAEIRARIAVSGPRDVTHATVPYSMTVDLLAEVDALMYERHEVHAHLTGKGEMGYCMTHPNGATTDLGKAAERANVKLFAAQADVRKLQGALREALTLFPSHRFFPNAARIHEQGKRVLAETGQP